MSKIENLLKFISEHNFEYNQHNKDRLKEIGIVAMKRLASALKLKEYKVSFNPGGIAVTGDLYLMGMFNDNIGIYISITKGWNRNEGFSFLYRTIKNMEDYSGGGNNYFRYIFSEKQIVNRIHQLCGVNPKDLKQTKSFSKRNADPSGKSIEQFTGNKRKDYKERYDRAYKMFQDHLGYGNYFQIGSGSHDRIHDLTLAALAYDNMVHFKGQMTGEGFLNTKFLFPSGNEGRPSALIDCYRPEMWDTFGRASNKFVLIEEEES